jgi:hypothetical protein
VRWLKVKSVKEAILEVFSKKNSFFYFSLGTIFFAALYVYIPIRFTPGNTLAYFLEDTPWWGLLIIIVLSMLMGLLLAMQIYVWKSKRTVKMREVGTGFSAVFSGVLSGLFSTATCAACFSALLSFFLPSAGVLALFDYQLYIVGGGMVLVLLSIVLTSSRITGNCKSCKIKLK